MSSNTPSDLRKLRWTVNGLLVAGAAGVLLLGPGLHANHRWIGVWVLLVLAVFALIPMHDESPDGSVRETNIASNLAGRPVALTARARGRIEVDELPSSRRRSARIVAGVAFVLFVLLMV